MDIFGGGSWRIWRVKLEDMEGQVGENRIKDGIKSRNYKLEKTELDGLRVKIRDWRKADWMY